MSLCNASSDSTKGVEGNISRLKVVQLISSDHTHHLIGVSESKYLLQGQKHSNRHVVNDNISDFVVLLSVLPCCFNILCSFFNTTTLNQLMITFTFSCEYLGQDLVCGSRGGYKRFLHKEQVYWEYLVSGAGNTQTISVESSTSHRW